MEFRSFTYSMAPSSRIPIFWGKIVAVVEIGNAQLPPSDPSLFSTKRQDNDKMKWDKENEKSIIHWWASVEQLLSSTVSQSMGWITRSFWLYFYRMNEDDEVNTLIQVKTDFILVCKGSRTCWPSSTLFWALSWDQCDCYVWLLGVTNRFIPPSDGQRSDKNGNAFFWNLKI